MAKGYPLEYHETSTHNIYPTLQLQKSGHPMHLFLFKDMMHHLIYAETSLATILL